MTNEELERELSHLATKEGLAELRAELHRDLGAFKYDLTWRLIQILGVQTAIILGAMYFMLQHLRP